MAKNSVPFHDQYFNQAIGQYLLKDKLIDTVKLKEAENYCQLNQISLCSFLVQTKQLSSSELVKCAVANFKLPFFDLKELNLAILTSNLFPLSWMRQFRVIPIEQNETWLAIGMVDPSCFSIITKIRFHMELPIRIFIVDEEAIESVLTTFSALNHPINLNTLLHEARDVIDIDNQMSNVPTDENEPIANLVKQLFLDAFAAKASDIHCEPYLGKYRVRFRVDGLLFEKAIISPELAQRMLARIKLLSHLDVTEKRLPQDGRIKMREPAYEVRVSTCPTIEGEKIALRLFGERHENLTLESLGFFNEQLHLIMRSINKPYGLIIVTGPTGSGKTATLYAILNKLKNADKNIITIEEPVEMIIPGINQVSVNHHIGLSFSAVLRTLLRQDPDVIMVGEIRDAETAVTAIQAASTGHLVLGTLHANHSLAAINRLNLLGISLEDCLQTLLMCVTQRLLRKLCPHCKKASGHIINFLVYAPTGCDKCTHGYQGRTGVFEVFVPDHNLVMLLNNPSFSLFEIESTLHDAGWLTLNKAALKKTLQGETSFEELERVIGYV